MSFQAGDLVQTTDGIKGEIVLLTKDGRSAYIRIIGGTRGACATLRPLVSLRKIGGEEIG